MSGRAAQPLPKEPTRADCEIACLATLLAGASARKDTSAPRGLATVSYNREENYPVEIFMLTLGKIYQECKARRLRRICMMICLVSQCPAMRGRLGTYPRTHQSIFATCVYCTFTGGSKKICESS